MTNVESKVYKNRWLILFIVAMEPLMACLDSSIVNVALPSMAKSFSVSMASIEWVVTSYLIVIVATMLIFGRLGDIKGKTVIYNLGIILFTIGSLFCGISINFPMLIASRIVQGIGAAATMATNQGIATQVFPKSERGRALGTLGTFVAIGNLAGPPLGGFILTAASWKYIFLINIPVGIITFILGIKNLPKKADIKDEKVDAIGATIFIISIVSLFMSISKGQVLGYRNTFIILGFILAIIFMAAFLYLEKRIEQPLLNLSIFKNQLFTISIICAFISFVSIGGLNIIQPFYLQDVMKFTPALTGLIMTVNPLILGVAAPVSGYISDKVGSELITLIGLLLSAIGFFFMAALNEYSSILQIIICIAILSIGNAAFQSPNTSLIMSSVPKQKLGIAGSINALVRNLGMTFGVSLSTTLLYSRMSHKIGYKVVGFVEGREDAFVYGMRIVYICAAILCVVGAAITSFRFYERKVKKVLS